MSSVRLGRGVATYSGATPEGRFIDRLDDNFVIGLDRHRGPLCRERYSSQKCLALQLLHRGGTLRETIDQHRASHGLPLSEACIFFAQYAATPYWDTRR